MSTPAGERTFAGAAVGFLAVLADLVLVQLGHGADRSRHLGVTALAIGMLHALCATDRRQVGLVFRPRPSLV